MSVNVGDAQTTTMTIEIDAPLDGDENHLVIQRDETGIELDSFVLVIRRNLGLPGCTFYPNNDGTIVIQAEEYSTLEVNDELLQGSWIFGNNYPDFSSRGYMEANIGGTPGDDSSVLTYNMEFDGDTDLFIYFRVQAESSIDDSFALNINDEYTGATTPLGTQSRCRRV